MPTTSANGHAQPTPTEAQAWREPHEPQVQTVWELTLRGRLSARMVVVEVDDGRGFQAAYIAHAVPPDVLAATEVS
jgi:hypothetical protein